MQLLNIHGEVKPKSQLLEAMSTFGIRLSGSITKKTGEYFKKLSRWIQSIVSILEIPIYCLDCAKGW